MSIVIGCVGMMTYLHVALGTQEWLNRRLAKGKIPCPYESRCEWSTKLLLPKRP